MTTPLRPGQLRPNHFEVAILQHMANKNPSLSGTIETLQVLSREFTGVGSFTNFACPDAPPDAPQQHLGLDAEIRMPGIPNGMGAVLFCKAGIPECLEVFTYGDDHWDGVYDGFSIE